MLALRENVKTCLRRSEGFISIYEFHTVIPAWRMIGAYTSISKAGGRVRCPSPPQESARSGSASVLQTFVSATRLLKPRRSSGARPVPIDRLDERQVVRAIRARAGFRMS